MKINLYLNFLDNCDKAFSFYQNVFNVKPTLISRFKDLPPSDEYPLNSADADKIIHISLPITPNIILMGSDTPSFMIQNFKQGNNFTISLNSSDQNALAHFFKALSTGGEIIMPAGPTFWSPYYGQCVDAFGINWMVNQDPE